MVKVCHAHTTGQRYPSYFFFTVQDSRVRKKIFKSYKIKALSIKLETDSHLKSVYVQWKLVKIQRSAVRCVVVTQLFGLGAEVVV